MVDADDFVEMTKNYAQGIVPSTPQDDCSQGEKGTANGDGSVREVKKNKQTKTQGHSFSLTFFLEMSESGVCFLGSTRWSWSQRETKRLPEVLGVLAEVQCCWSLSMQEHLEKPWT